MIPTMTEWTCETSYPIGEPTVTGFLWAIAHVNNFLYYLIYI